MTPQKRYLTKPIIILIIFALIILGFVLTQILTPKNTQEISLKPVQTTPPQPITEITIIMKDETYDPQDIEIKKNTKVIFRNQSKEDRWPASNLHPTHTIYPEFDPKQPIKSNQDWSFIFDKVGVWKYHDHLAPFIRGQITVTN